LADPGHLSEALGWAKAILGQDIEMLPGIRWKLLTACGNISQFQGAVTKAYEFYTEALAAARKSGNQTYVSQSLRGLGALAYVDLDFREARKLLSEALLISRKEGDAFGLAASLARLGDISNVEGDLSTARELTSEALEIFRNIGYLEGVSAKLYNLGAIVFLEGDHQMALSYFEEAHTAALELGEKINTRLILTDLPHLRLNKVTTRGRQSSPGQPKASEQLSDTP
jgi:tetratricopeptide (TPR) repeat protein